MRLLVTRPSHQATITIDAMTKDGHDCILSPMLNLHQLDLPLPTGIFGLIALTSRNAVKGLKQRWPEADRDKIPVFTVGDATKDAILAAGFSNAFSCSGTAIDLVEKVSAAYRKELIRQEPDNSRILYPCALQTAHDLPALFAERGHNCSAWPVYAMEEAIEFSPDALSGLSSEQIDGVLLYSARSAKTFTRLFLQLTNSPTIPALFALSEAICNVLPPVLAASCRYPAQPTETALRLLLSQNNN